MSFFYTPLFHILIILALFICYRYFWYSVKHKHYGNIIFLSIFAGYMTGFLPTRFRTGSYIDAFASFIFSFLIYVTVIFLVVYLYEKFFKKNNSTNHQSLSSINKINPKTFNTVYKSPVQTPSPTPIKPSEKIVSNYKKEDTVKTDFKPTIEDNTMNDESYEITEQEQQDLFNQVKITPEEEEQIYADVSKETEPDKRKEGIWTKALIQSDGDEQKTKITYMKLRVEIIINELKNAKFNEIISTLIEKRKKHLNLEKIIDKEKNRRELFETAESNYWHSEVIDHYKIGKVRIRIFSHKDKKMDPYYWVKSVDEKNKYNRSFWKTKNLVIEDIRKHLEELLRENEESQKNWDGMTSKNK